MRKMFRMAVMAAAMFVAVSSVAKAQDVAQQQGRRGGGGRGGFNMAILDSIKANDAQKAKVDSIVKAYQAENAPLQEAARGGDADAMGKIQANRTKMMDAIKALFTDEQKKDIDRLTPQRGRRGGGPAPK
jgi:Spy/CpxP family protein refolding chaperone